MPIYEYECNACGEHHEFIQKFSDAPKRKCPACGKSRLRKLVSAAAFHLKGDGWYVTDFRDKDKKKNGKDVASETKGEAASESKAQGKDETKADAKADTKADAKAEKKGGGKKKKGDGAAATV